MALPATVNTHPPWKNNILINKGPDHCCPTYSPSLRDAYREVGGRAKQDARAERAGESEARGRESNQSDCLIFHPLILPISRSTQRTGKKEKGRNAHTVIFAFIYHRDQQLCAIL